MSDETTDKSRIASDLAEILSIFKPEKKSIYKYIDDPSEGYYDAESEIGPEPVNRPLKNYVGKVREQVQAKKTSATTIQSAIRNKKARDELKARKATDKERNETALFKAGKAALERHKLLIEANDKNRLARIKALEEKLEKQRIKRNKDQGGKIGLDPKTYAKSVKDAKKLGISYFGDDKTHTLEEGKKFKQSLVNPGRSKGKKKN